MTNSFGARQTLTTGKVDRDIFRLDSAGGQFDSLPFTLKVLLENLLRCEDGVSVTPAHIEAVLEWDDPDGKESEFVVERSPDGLWLALLWKVPPSGSRARRTDPTQEARAGRWVRRDRPYRSRR